MSGRSKWKTYTVRECGCQDQIRRSGKQGNRVKPCVAHTPDCPDPNPYEDTGNYFDNFVDGNGW